MEVKKDHEFCLRCGRRLRNPQTREIGYGAICYKKIQTEKSRQLFNFSEASQSYKEEGERLIPDEG